MHWISEFFATVGPNFMPFYVLMLFGSLLLIVLIQWLLKSDGEVIYGQEPDPCSIAYLCAGPTRAAKSVIAHMVHGKVLDVRETDGHVFPAQSLPRISHELEQSAFAAAATFNGLRVVAAPRAMAAALKRQREKPIADGFLQSTGRRLANALIADVPFFLVLGIGFARIVRGSTSGHSVNTLVLLMGICLLVAIILMTLSGRRTRAGDAVVKAAASKTRAARASAGRASTRLTGVEVAMVTAVHGLRDLGGHGLGPLKRIWEPDPRRRSAFGGAGGCGCGAWGTSCGGGCGG